MFGWKRKKPLKLVPFAEERPRTFNSLLCDGVTAYNLPDFAELLTLHARLRQDHPDFKILASLDDLGQACYTAGHGTDANELDDIEGHDLSGLDPAAFEDGDHRGYLTTPSEFPIRLANLRKRADSVALADIAGLLDWETTGDANDCITINSDPNAALNIARERDVIFQFVPVSSPAETIAAFPNGYFASDLNPMQNLVLARHLEAKYGLLLFGIGSRFLGFRREQPLDEITEQALAAELAAFYAGTPPEAVNPLAGLLAGRDWLLIRYTES